MAVQRFRLPLLFLDRVVKIKQVLDSINSRRLRSPLRGLYHRKGPGRKAYNDRSRIAHVGTVKMEKRMMEKQGGHEMKHRLWDMSWKEAEEAFKRSDTVILPVGTLHGHGPTPISIDSSSVDWLAQEVGSRTGLVTLPLLAYGENDKQKYYPGTIAISLDTLERFYVDIFRSLSRNGVRRVIVLNGHGGNREVLIRAGRAAREFGMIIAIPEWWSIGRQIMPELFPEKGSYMVELAVSLAIGGKDIADLRGTGYMGEWGDKYTMRNIFGDEIVPQGFNSFEYKGGRIIIPVQAWDLDIEGPPVLGTEVVDELYERGQRILRGLVDYLVDFAEKFKKVEIAEALKSKDKI